MKKIVFSLFVTMFMTGIIFMSCNSSGKKSDQNQDSMTSEQLAMKQAIKDSVVQLQNQTSEIINANERSISDLKDKLSLQSKEIKAKYEKKLEALDQKNSDLKIKLEEYKEDERTEKWEAFKKDYNKEIEDIKASLKDLSVNIVK